MKNVTINITINISYEPENEIQDKIKKADEKIINVIDEKEKEKEKINKNTPNKNKAFLREIRNKYKKILTSANIKLDWIFSNYGTLSEKKYRKVFIYYLSNNLKLSYSEIGIIIGICFSAAKYNIALGKEIVKNDKLMLKFYEFLQGIK
jgi:hypothetical protein